MRNLTKEEIEKALANDAWDLGNQVLYDLCSQHPLHKSQQEIIAKVWLIGRSYAAALERRKNKSSDSVGDLFYEDKAFPKIQNSEIDSWIGSLKNNSKPEEAIEAHFKLTKLFHEISELGKRSLASKYLHFHQPNLFFIYDSRAVKAISQITPASEKQLPSLSPIEQDGEYLKFYRRCLWLRDELESKLGRKPSPREIDKVLLVVADNRI
jgi:hypothetical protein